MAQACARAASAGMPWGQRIRQDSERWANLWPRLSADPVVSGHLESSEGCSWVPLPIARLSVWRFPPSRQFSFSTADSPEGQNLSPHVSLCPSGRLSSGNECDQYCGKRFLVPLATLGAEPRCVPGTSLRIFRSVLGTLRNSGIVLRGLSSCDPNNIGKSSYRGGYLFVYLNTKTALTFMYSRQLGG